MRALHEKRFTGFWMVLLSISLVLVVSLLVLFRPSHSKTCGLILI